MRIFLGSTDSCTCQRNSIVAFRKTITTECMVLVLRGDGERPSLRGGMVRPLPASKSEAPRPDDPRCAPARAPPQPVWRTAAVDNRAARTRDLGFCPSSSLVDSVGGVLERRREVHHDFVLVTTFRCQPSVSNFSGSRFLSFLPSQRICLAASQLSQILFRSVSQLHIYTASQLRSLQFHDFLSHDAQLHSCTAAQLHRFTASKSFKATAAPCTHPFASGRALSQCRLSPLPCGVCSLLRTRARRVHMRFLWHVWCTPIGALRCATRVPKSIRWTLQQKEVQSVCEHSSTGTRFGLFDTRIVQQCAEFDLVDTRFEDTVTGFVLLMNSIEDISKTV